MTLRILALDTSTHRLSVGLAVLEPALPPPATGAETTMVWLHEGEGGAQASNQLIPSALGLLAQAGTSLAGLDALAWGRGPGSFTGLRTTAAVVQGLAYGTRTPRHPLGLPVLGIDTLLAVAEDARHQLAHRGLSGPCTITALLDARMDELYAATYRFPEAQQAIASLQGGPWLCRPEQLGLLLSEQAQAGTLAGNAWDTYGPRLPTTAQPSMEAWPTAAALLRLAPHLLRQGAATPAADAQPLYVRDKVAQTTEERAPRTPPRGAEQP